MHDGSVVYTLLLYNMQYDTVTCSKLVDQLDS